MSRTLCVTCWTGKARWNAILNLDMTEIGHCCLHWTVTTLLGLLGERMVLVAFNKKIWFVSKKDVKKNPKGKSYMLANNVCGVNILIVNKNACMACVLENSNTNKITWFSSRILLSLQGFPGISVLKYWQILSRNTIQLSSFPDELSK